MSDNIVPGGFPSTGQNGVPPQSDEAKRAAEQTVSSQGPSAHGQASQHGESQQGTPQQGAPQQAPGSPQAPGQHVPGQQGHSGQPMPGQPGYGYPQGGYGQPGQGYPGQPMNGQPLRPGAPYPQGGYGQPGQGYPGQPGQPQFQGQPGQGYPGQPMNGQPLRPGAPYPQGGYGQPGQGYPGQPGQPGQPTRFAGQGSTAAAGTTGSGQGVSKKLLIGIGAGLLALLLLIWGLTSLTGKKDSGSAAGDSSNSAPKAAGPEGEAEQVVQDYIANLKDGKAQEAIKKLDTSTMTGFDGQAAIFQDELYSKVQNRPQGFTKTGVTKISDDWVDIEGKVKQKDRDLDVKYTVKKVGGQWKLHPMLFASATAPYVDATDFPLTVNGTEVKEKTSIFMDALPGDYEFSSTNNKYFTSSKVAKTVWADGTDEGNSSAATDIKVKATDEAKKTAEKVVQDTLATCAAKLDNKTCGTKFNAKGVDFKLTDLKITIKSKPVLDVTSDSSPARFSVDSSKDGVLTYNYKADGKPETQEKDFSVVGSAELKPDGTVKSVKIY